MLAADPQQRGVANDADTSGYNARPEEVRRGHRRLQAIAQFLDRDTVPAFAGPNGMQGLLQNFLGNPDQDLAAYQQSIQDAWDTLSVQ